MQRPARDFGLIGIVQMRFDRRTSASGTLPRQRRFQAFLDLLRRRRRPMSMLAMLLAGLAARSLGMFLGRMLGKRSRLTLGRSLGGLQADLEAYHLRLEFGVDFRAYLAVA
jgi:hypothetical protein